MAETFRGKNHSIYTSNNGGAQLIGCLVDISLKIDSNEHLQNIQKYLDQLITNSIGSFSLDPDIDFPNTFKDVSNLKALSLIIKKLAFELTKTRPNLKWDIAWTREVRLKWLAQTIQLHEMLQELLVENGVQTENLKIILEPEENLIFQYHLISSYYNECCKRNVKHKYAKKLKLLNKLIPILETLEKGKDELFLRYEQRHEIHVLFGNNHKAIHDLQKCMVLTNDAEEKELLQECITVLTDNQA